MLQARPKSTTQSLNLKQQTKRPSLTNFQQDTQQITLNNNNLGEPIQFMQAIPIYKGLFVNFHQEEIRLDESVQLSGIEDGFAFIVLNEQIIQFYFYSPLHEDLNFYYNTDKKYRFPIRVKEQKISHVEYITAVGFQCLDDVWTMAVASEFYIHLYTFTGDLDNFQMLKKGFNINGEVVNQIKFHHDNLIYGGSLGTLTCKSIDSAQHYAVRVKEKIKKQFNRIFRDLTPWASNQGLIQLEIVDDLHICFGLFEKYDKDENVDETYITVYDIGLQGERFQEIFTLKQSVLYNTNLDFKNNFNYQNLQFYHVYFQKHLQKILMIITTKFQIQLQLQFEVDISQQSLKPEYQIIQVKYPYLKIDSQIPYGVCLDESRIQYRQREALAIQLNQTLKSVFREEQLALFHLDNSLIAQFLDMAHLQYLKHMEQSVTRQNSLLYRDTALEALEKIDLNGSNDHLVPKNLYAINRQTINRIFSHSDINESQLYNLPDHYVCIADNSIEFLVRLRPIDCFFTAIKVTHYDFLEHIDLDFPLEKLVRAYGIEESCSQILQIIIQEDQLFYVNVELQHQYQLDLQKAYQRIHYSENIQKFFDDNEKIPVWVTGQVYTRKGQIIKEKALKAYFSLIKRSLLNEDRSQKSKKVQSTTTLIWKILAPLTTKKFINEQVYNLQCNKPMESYSVQQLQIVFKQVDKLIKLFENEPNFYQKDRQSKLDSRDEMNQNQTYKNGFSKYIYETFEQSTRLDLSRSTAYSSDQSLAVSINVDVEHNQMKELYTYCRQIKQLLQFLTYFFGELQGIRNIINSFQNKTQLFDLSIKSVLCTESNGLFTLKQLMIHIIKSDKSKFRECAQYMHHHFPDFFTMQDFKISLAQNLFDEILTFAAHKNLIKLNPNEQYHEKIKRILKLSKAPQITIDKVLEKQEIFVYYKELQPELQEQLKEALKSVEEVVCAIQHSYLSQGFFNYMFPFATFKYYIQYLAQKSKHLEKDQQSNEYRTCVVDLIQQFNMLIQYYQKPPKGLTKYQAREILIESLQVLNQYKNLKATEVIANDLFKAQLKEFIAYIDYNQDLDLQCNELEKLQMLKKQLLSKAGDQEILQLINLLLKLAQFSLEQNSEMSLEDIQNRLPLSKRLRYVTKAQEFIRIYQRNTHLVDISDLDNQARDLSKLVFLQDIMYDYVVTNDVDNKNYQNERRKILVKLLDYKIILQFFQDNEIYFGQLICYDFIEEKENAFILNEQDLDQLWIEYILKAYEENEEWPSEVFKTQLKILFENFSNPRRFIRLEKMTETIELINARVCQDHEVTQLTNWFLFEVLLNHDVQQIDLLNIYLHHYLISINVQENEVFKRLLIKHLYTYKLQLIQQILILIDALKKNKLQVGQQILKFRNAFEDDYRYLLSDDQFDQQVIMQIKERIDKL